MSKGNSLGYCKTCKCEIVEFVNEGVFGEGDCEFCEYRRYRTQPELLAACESASVAFDERLSNLEDEKEWRADDEYEDMVGNYQCLKRKVDRVIAIAEGSLDTGADVSGTPSANGRRSPLRPTVKRDKRPGNQAGK